MFGRSRLERRLRAERPVPAEDFVRHLTATIAEESAPIRRRPSVRLGLAAVVAVCSLVAAGVTGGLGYGASAVSHASTSLAHTLASPVSSASHATSTSSSSSINSSLVAATNTQYTTAGYYCFRTAPRGNNYKEIYISSQTDYLSYTGKGYVALRYDASEYLQSTCNYGHLK